MPTKEKGALVPAKGKIPLLFYGKNKFACRASLASKADEKQLMIKGASDFITLKIKEKEPATLEKWRGREKIVSRTWSIGLALVLSINYLVICHLI